MGAAFAPIMLGLQTISKLNAASQQAAQQRAYYNNQAKLQENEAAINKLQASQLADKYANEERQIINSAKTVRGRNNAAAGAANLNSSGSVGDVQNASTDEAIRNLRMSLSNQKSATWQQRVSETGHLTNANNYRLAADKVDDWENQQYASTILGAVGTAFGQGMFGSSSSGSSLGSDNAWSFDSANMNNSGWIGNNFSLSNMSNGWTYGNKSSWNSSSGYGSVFNWLK